MRLTLRNISQTHQPITHLSLEMLMMPSSCPGVNQHIRELGRNIEVVIMKYVRNPSQGFAGHAHLGCNILRVHH